MTNVHGRTFNVHGRTFNVHGRTFNVRRVWRGRVRTAVCPPLEMGYVDLIHVRGAGLRTMQLVTGLLARI